MQVRDRMATKFGLSKCTVSNRKYEIFLNKISQAFEEEVKMPWGRYAYFDDLRKHFPELNDEEFFASIYQGISEGVLKAEHSSPIGEEKWPEYLLEGGQSCIYKPRMDRGYKFG